MVVLLCCCSLLEKVEQETWRETGISFVTSVTRLMERLLDYRWVALTAPPAGHLDELKLNLHHSVCSVLRS